MSAGEIAGLIVSFALWGAVLSIGYGVITNRWHGGDQ